MPRARKAVPSGEPSASASAAGKKRKAEGPKYYAVQVGKRPGVYLTYEECTQQTSGYKGARFKSFLSRQDAQAFADGKKVQASSDEPEKFYAVAVGRPPGIYNDWSDASEAIKGVKGPKYKKFGTREEAAQFIREFGGSDALASIGEAVEEYQDEEDEEEDIFDVEESRPAKKVKQTAEKDDGFMKIYTDGSSRANGRAGARAGIGVFFGEGNLNNISEPLPGELQTNQRAELMAMLRALEVVAEDQNVRIISDSKYSISCVTEWAKKWEKAGWTTSNGETVKNQDIIRGIRARLDERSQAGGETDFQWVKGHSTDKGNVAADLLAVNGAKQR